MEPKARLVRIRRSHPKAYPEQPGEVTLLLVTEADRLIKEGFVEYVTDEEIVAILDAKAGIDEEEVEALDASDSITKPFDPQKIDISTKQASLDTILKRLMHGEIDLQTSFQRKENLWTNRDQSRLIESILIRFPLPAFYFDGSNPDRWLVVDGLQRLSALRRFIITEELELIDLEYLEQFNGFKYSKLPRPLQRIIEETQLTLYIINAGTPREVKFNIFKRINTGGLVLSPQEIRHALNQGVPAKFVEELASLSIFKEVTGGAVRADRMEDRDFAMRFIGFYITPYIQYETDLESFLNTQMSKLAQLTTSELADIRNNFIRSLELAAGLFGHQAFRKMTAVASMRKPLNKALFEIWTVSLTRLTNAQALRLFSQRQELLKRFIILLQDEAFNRAISTGTGNRNRVILRFNSVERLIVDVLNESGDSTPISGFSLFA